jgi:hypothetical protein
VSPLAVIAAVAGGGCLLAEVPQNVWKFTVNTRHQLRGWALRDPQGRTHGWHHLIAGDDHWATADSALRAFLATANDRRKRALMGWHIEPTAGIDDLNRLLHATRGETTPENSDEH